MKIDARAVEPFNEWWRKSNHCEPSPQAIEAFAAGFKAGLKCGVEGAMAVLNATPDGAIGSPSTSTCLSTAPFIVGDLPSQAGPSPAPTPADKP